MPLAPSLAAGTRQASSLPLKVHFNQQQRGKERVRVKQKWDLQAKKARNLHTRLIHGFMKSPHKMSLGWKQDQEDPPEALMGPKSKPPTNPGTPSISVSKSQAMWQGLMYPLVYLHRYGLDIYTNSTNICSFIRQDKR